MWCLSLAKRTYSDFIKKIQDSNNSFLYTNLPKSYFIITSHFYSEKFYFILSFFNYRGVLVDKQCSTIASTTSRIDNFIGCCINFDDTRRIILDVFAEIDQQRLLYGIVR